MTPPGGLKRVHGKDREPNRIRTILKSLVRISSMNDVHLAEARASVEVSSLYQCSSRSEKRKSTSS